MTPFDLRAIRIVLAAIWLLTGILSLWIYPRQESFALLARVGITDVAAVWVLYLASGINITLGLLTLLLRRRMLWVFQAVVVTCYTLLITFWLPEFWLHPFGPILKNSAVLMLLWLLYRYEPAQS